MTKTAAVVVVACLASSTSALAANCPPAPGERLHDGFYARSTAGIAYLLGSRLDSVSGAERSAVRGLGQSSKISIGGTLAPTLVVGGAIEADRIDPTFVEGGRSVSSDDDSVKISFLRLGPFLDWYPNPTRGFHAQAGLGLALNVETDTKGDGVEPLGIGPSLSLGVGHEWFVAGELSLGVLGYVVLGPAIRSPTGGAEDWFFVTPTLALTATYH